MNKRFLAFVTLGLAVMGGLFWLLKPDAPRDTSITVATDAQLTAPTPSPPEEAGAGPAKPAVIAIEIREGRRFTGPEVIQVVQGQKLSLRLLSDQDAELHLHGYDATIRLRAGQPHDWTFTAGHSGRFEFELHGQAHGAHGALGVIEVLPR